MIIPAGFQLVMGVRTPLSLVDLVDFVEGKIGKIYPNLDMDDDCMGVPPRPVGNHHLFAFL